MSTATTTERLADGLPAELLCSLASTKLAYRSPNFHASLPSRADAAYPTIARAAFSASSARIRNEP
jgi:hypothetical protein